MWILRSSLRSPQDDGGVFRGGYGARCAPYSDGFVWGAYHRKKVEVIHEGYAGLRKIWAKGILKPHISHRFPLIEAGEAMRTLLARKSTGKVVVEVRG